MAVCSRPSNSTIQKGRPLNIHFFGGMDLPKLHTVCTPEKHWQTVLVNAESVSYPKQSDNFGVHDIAVLTSSLAKFFPRPLAKLEGPLELFL